MPWHAVAQDSLSIRLDSLFAGDEYTLLPADTLPLPPSFLSASDSALNARLNELIARRLPRGSNVAVYAYDLTANRPLFEYQADLLSRPASTMKVVTAIAALSVPGADRPFHTEVGYTGTIRKDTLHGDLYMIGGFDPEFDDDALDSLVRAVSRLPFSVVQGKVYGDVSAKDTLHWGSGWLWDDDPAPYQPYLSPLMLDKGTVNVSVYPGQTGQPARVVCRPESTYYTILNRTRSRSRAAGPFRAHRDWQHHSNIITLEGSVTRGEGRTFNVYDSQRFFMHTFTERLQQSGISCPNGYGFREVQRADGYRRIACYETSVQKVLDEMLKESDNLNAEAMLWHLGSRVTGGKQVAAKESLKAVKRLIARLGLNPKHYSLADGCGLSHYDYVSPRLLVTLLRHAYRTSRIFTPLYKALPVSGVDGTLKYRMGYGSPGFRKVHAKTGSYTGINSLAGYLQTLDGRWIAFAIMNQNVLSGRKARALQDDICLEIIRSKGQKKEALRED